MQIIPAISLSSATIIDPNPKALTFDMKRLRDEAKAMNPAVDWELLLLSACYEITYAWGYPFSRSGS